MPGTRLRQGYAEAFLFWLAAALAEAARPDMTSRCEADSQVVGISTAIGTKFIPLWLSTAIPD